MASIVEGGSMADAIPQELVDAFRRDGYVVVPDLLPPEELDRFEQAVTAGVRDRGAAGSLPLEQRSRYQQSFTQCMNLWEDHPDVRPLTFHPRVGEVAAGLLGVDALRLWHDQALYKEAGGRETDAHQDHPYWPIKETASITAWVPFQGSTLASGAMGYVPGSHLVGMRKFVNIFFGEPEDILAEPEVADVAPVFVEVPRGGVAFHHGLTVHLAKSNTTGRDRAVHTMIFFPDGSTRGYPFPHFCVDRGGIEMGEPIASDATPIAWPRPAGDYPPVPAVPIFVPPGFKETGIAPSRS